MLTVPLVGIPELATSVAEAPVLPMGTAEVFTASDPGPLVPGEDGGSLTTLLAHGRTWLALAWIVGTFLVLVWSLGQILRFDRLLRLASAPAPPALQDVAERFARRLGLRATPAICTTSANISPMV